MNFRVEEIEKFKSIFAKSQPFIQDFQGCKHVELWQELNFPEKMTTFSIWESEEALNNYRKSELFQTTWAQTKILFQAPPVANSYTYLLP